MPEASLTLPAELSSIGAARRFLRAALDDWQAGDYEMGAAQVLTELATNAALHARSAYTVHLVLEPNELLVEVTDSSPVPPQARGYGSDATTGRGIALVEALSTRWGVEASPTGKTVWCRIARDREVFEGLGAGLRTADRGRPGEPRRQRVLPRGGAASVRTGSRAAA